jgi:hypothetical protein
MHAYATRCVAHALAPVVAERNRLDREHDFALIERDQMRARADAAEKERDELRSLLRDYRAAPKFGNPEAIRETLALEDCIDAALATKEPK